LNAANEFNQEFPTLTFKLATTKLIEKEEQFLKEIKELINFPL